MDELLDFYERYIAAFNAGDREGFAGFFHLPVTVVHAGRYDDRRSGRPLALLTDPASLWAPLAGSWVRSTIDSIVPLADASPFVPHDGLNERPGTRPGLLATVTRWHEDGSPYQHIQALYLLTRESGRLGIKVLVELTTADRPS